MIRRRSTAICSELFVNPILKLTRKVDPSSSEERKETHRGERGYGDSDRDLLIGRQG
jgi:hypothetical protein